MSWLVGGVGWKVKGGVDSVDGVMFEKSWAVRSMVSVSAGLQ